MENLLILNVDEGMAKKLQDFLEKEGHALIAWQWLTAEGNLMSGSQMSLVWQCAKCDEIVELGKINERDEKKRHDL